MPTAATKPKRKAYRVVCRPITRDAGIYSAETAPKAKAQALAQATEAGYDVNWTDFRVTRAPEYDQWAEGWKRNGVGEDYVVGCMKAMKGAADAGQS